MNIDIRNVAKGLIKGGQAPMELVIHDHTGQVVRRISR